MTENVKCDDIISRQLALIDEPVCVCTLGMCKRNLPRIASVNMKLTTAKSHLMSGN